MLGKYASGFILVTQYIDEILGNLRELERLPPSGDAQERVTLALLAQAPPIPPTAGKHVVTTVKTLMGSLGTRMPLPSFNAQALRIVEMVERGSSIQAVRQAVEELKTRLHDELKSREFYYVPPERVTFYVDKQQFGPEVNDRFPSAIDDIEGAGKCLALGEGTACVLHCMRVMEVGLKALGKSLKIPYAPSWESYLSQIAAKIAAKHKTKGIKWRRDEKFYRDVSGDLLSVKQAWRNPTMHVDRKYSATEAQEIFAAVRSLMQHLAKNLKP